MNTQAEWAQRYRGAIMNTFGDPAAVLVRGEGARVWDADGKEYLDLLGGLAVNCLGHAHPAWCDAIAQQARTLGHISNLFASPPQIMLAEKLLEISQAPAGSRVFFANTGTEANEAAIKLVLRTGRPRILAFEDAFHGRTMGALALTAKEEYRKPFAPFGFDVTHIPFGDSNALARELARGDVAALFVEVIQGEAGVVPLPPGFLGTARQLTRDAGALLVIDEVQTGMGRTGTWLAYQNPALVDQVIQPDVVTLAKGLGAGFPIGATIAYGEDNASRLGPGQHGTTFGGNPIAAAAGLATIDIIEAEKLVDLADPQAGKVGRLGRVIAAEVRALGNPLIDSSRGAGLLQGLVLTVPVGPQLVRIALREGFIVNAPRPNIIRLAPPYIVSEGQLMRFFATVPDRWLKEVER